MASKKKPSTASITSHKKLKAIDELRLELKLDKANKETKRLKAKYNAALRQLVVREREIDAVMGLRGPIETFKLTAKTPSGDSEATAFMVASDWHVEEEVRAAIVNGKNRYDLALAKSRAEQFFVNGLRLIEINRQATSIKNLVLALLGDFISGDIHDELVEVNQLLPVPATKYAASLIASGIQFLLDEGGFDEIVVPCHSGNHGRTTKKVHISTEAGHSLEYLLYTLLQMAFRHDPRVKFVLSDGYHSYLRVYDKTVRFHHGHMVKFQGGVGGIHIPVNKAINQWNKITWADLDVFGHFHQMKDGGNFISNGSLIGYNGFALSIKADYEPPKQAFFLIDRKKGRTITAPILFDDSKRAGVKMPEVIPAEPSK